MASPAVAPQTLTDADITRMNAPPATLTDADMTPNAAPETPSVASRLWHGFVSSLPNPVEAIKEWANRPDELRKAMDGLHTLNQLDAQAAKDPQNQGKPRDKWVMPAASADQKQKIETGMGARLGTGEGNLLSDTAAPAVAAGGQAAKGDYAGATGTLLGGYVAPVAAGEALGAAAEHGPAAARAVGKGIAAGAPDVAKGTAKTAAVGTLGYIAHQLGVNEIVEGMGLGRALPVLERGAAQIGQGLKTGWQAGKASLAEEAAAARAAAPPRTPAWQGPVQPADIAAAPADRTVAPQAAAPRPAPAAPTARVPAWQGPVKPADIPPGPADRTVAPQAPQVRTPVPEAPPAAPNPSAALRDGIAQGFGYKDFAAVKDPRAANTITLQADRIAAQGGVKAPAIKPPDEPGESGSTSATQPPPAAPSAPAGAVPEPEKGLPRMLITEKQFGQWATDHGLSAEDAQTQLDKQHTRVIDRLSLNKMLHAITGDHATLSDIAKNTYGVKSLKNLTDEQMLELQGKLAKEQVAYEPPTPLSPQEKAFNEAKARRARAAKTLGPAAPEPEAETRPGWTWPRPTQTK